MLRVGAGLEAEKEKTLTTRQRGLQDLPSDIVPRKWGFTKSKNPWYFKCGQNYICAGLAWLARLAQIKKKKKSTLSSHLKRFQITPNTKVADMIVGTIISFDAKRN